MQKFTTDAELISLADVDLITTAQMRAAEVEVMAAGTTGARLMERAGRAVADAICARVATGAHVDVLCGPGNNGGDGYVIARVLADRGYGVTLYSSVPTDRLTGDARAMAERWQGPAHLPERFVKAKEAAAVVVDALFGTGLARPLEGHAAAMIAAVNARPGVKVAVDIPSGVDGDTGEILGVAFDADLTVTFHAMKPGHALHPGRSHCGTVIVADIGLGPQATERARLASDGPELFVNDARLLLRDLGTDPGGHKYTKGHCLVLAGGLEGTGAARLAARAALRAGAGLVTLGVPGAALLAHASRPPDALMVRRCDGAEGLVALLADRRRNAVVLGPAYGVGEATRATVATVLGSSRPAVLDADALTSFEDCNESLFAMLRQAGNAVLTPHDGEFLRLFPMSAHATGDKPSKSPSSRSKRDEKPLENADLSSTSRLHRALEAAAKLCAVIVLKGPTTIIAAPDGRAAINTNAPPWLGTAGSGDVLAGIIGGLLSQGLGPFDAARAGVWLHGEAGTIAGRGLIADDLPEVLREIFKSMN